MGAVANAVVEFRVAILNDATIATLMRGDDTGLPPEQVNEWPVLLVYPKTNQWSFASQQSIKGLHTIRVALHANRQTKGLDGTHAELLTYVDEIPRVIYAAWEASRFAGTVSMLGAGSGSPAIRATWEPDELGGVQTFSIKYDIDIRIHEE